MEPRGAATSSWGARLFSDCAAYNLTYPILRWNNAPIGWWLLFNIHTFATLYAFVVGIWFHHAAFITVFRFLL